MRGETKSGMTDGKKWVRDRVLNDSFLELLALATHEVFDVG